VFRPGGTFNESSQVWFFVFADKKKARYYTGLFLGDHIKALPKCPPSPWSDHQVDPHRLHNHTNLSPKLITFSCCDPYSLGLTSSVTVVGAVLPQAVVGTAPSQAATNFLVHISYGSKVDAANFSTSTHLKCKYCATCCAM